MQNTLPLTRELLLIGGGHTHALVLRLWGKNPLPGVRVTVINPEPTAPYSGMLPGFVAGHYQRDELDIDLVRLARFANARLIVGRVVHLNPKLRQATLDNGRVLDFHVAALDVGITSEMAALPGFSEFAVPAKPLGRFASLWDSFRAKCARQDAPPKVVVIGGGVAGVELAMAMAHALEKIAGAKPEVTLIERSEILPVLKTSRQDFFRARLADCSVRVLEHTNITAIEKSAVILADKPPIAADFVVGAAGARAQDWLKNTGLTLENGFVVVDETLRSVNQPAIFAVGDCAHLSHAPRPKAGVFAVREAPILFANLRAALSSGKMQAFHPQSDYLKLISLGGKLALADKWWVMFRGPKVWQLKNRIDRTFMDQFSSLKPMQAAKIPEIVADGVVETIGDIVPCGGCGSKLGSQILNPILGKLPPPKREDVLSAPGDDAAILAGPNGSFQVISTDHLRAFTNDPALMARITAIHALGDIWAMGAKPLSALCNITLPRLSQELQQQWLAEIMQATQDVFTGEGTEIIGGHSSSGAELCIGLTVTGLRDQQPIGKAGAKPGDKLILTKPIGTGVILAAEMVLKARGEWVAAAFDSMARPQSVAAKVLSQANAMTDITGFGLAGHLAELADASGVGYKLDLNAIPLLDGAVELAAMGIQSSLFAENRANVGELAPPKDARFDLLFDPQTAGGLLAAVPAEQVKDLINKIRKLNCDAYVIGEIIEAASGRQIV